MLISKVTEVQLVTDQHGIDAQLLGRFLNGFCEVVSLSGNGIGGLGHIYSRECRGPNSGGPVF